MLESVQECAQFFEVFTHASNRLLYSWKVVVDIAEKEYFRIEQVLTNVGNIRQHLLRFRNVANIQIWDRFVHRRSPRGRCRPTRSTRPAGSRGRARRRRSTRASRRSAARRRSGTRPTLLRRDFFDFFVANFWQKLSRRMPT